MNSKTKLALGLGAVGLLGLFAVLALRDPSGAAAVGDEWIRQKYSANVAYGNNAGPKAKPKAGADASGTSTNAPSDRR